MNDIAALLARLSIDEVKVLEAEADKLTEGMKWFPNAGPQTSAYFSDVDELFYGGSAGGGKSDLAIGLAVNAHKRSLILRREREQVQDLFDRCGEILDTDKGRNGQQLRWDYNGRLIKFGGCKEERDKQKYKGRPYDLYVFDEISDFLRSQYEFIKTWNRSAVPGQRCRILCTGNPPTTAEGLWIIEYWGAWLDPTHKNPAKEGEIRWYTTRKDGKQIEVDGVGPHTITYEDGSTETMRARSRSFIRAKLSDNPFLVDTEYGANLDALPAALRAAYRDGRFDLSMEDDPWQVIPTSWIIASQQKWTPLPPQDVPMCAIGVDVAQGGNDSTTLAPRYDGWYAPLTEVEGKKTPTPRDVVALIIRERRDAALPIVDMGGGYGGGVTEGLRDNQIKYAEYKGASSAMGRSKCGTFIFNNKRSQSYWTFREDLDPSQLGGSQIMLPDDPRLVSDLTAARYSIKRGTGGAMELSITDKVTLVAKLGRSPDRGDAVVMAWTAGDKQKNIEGGWKNRARSTSGQRKVIRGYANRK